MTGLEFLFASTVAAAAPTVPTPWFEMDDYPVQAFDRRHEGVTAFQLLVDPSGRAVGCTVEASSGHESLDRRACAIATKRARFTPARSASGGPAYGVYRTRIQWAVDPSNYAQSEYGPDFEVSVNRLPDGAATPVSVKYAVEVDASGAPVACSPITSGHSAELTDLGCAKIKQDYRKQVASVSGTPIAAVQTAWITFTQ
jgi:TonB family protein